MRKVAIVGVEGSGKTVLMAALGQYYARPDADGYFLLPSDQKTFMMVRRINHSFLKGEWPLSTTNEQMVQLNWTLWKRIDKQREKVCDLSLLDYGGEVYRMAYFEGDIAGVDRSQYQKEIENLKNHIAESDAVLVLINLRDIVELNLDNDRMDQMLWITQQIFQQAEERNKDIGMALAFSQYETYRAIVESKGGIEEVYEKYLPFISSPYPNMKLLTFTAVANCETNSKGEVVPPAGKDIQSIGMQELCTWLISKYKEMSPTQLLSPKVGDVRVIDLPGGAKMEMVWCPPGTYMQGTPAWDEGADWLKKDRSENTVKARLGIPARKVTLTKGFWIGKYEVTQVQWQSVMGKNPSRFKSANRPVENVSWDECQEFCKKVGQGARLPTEAEWEYACRAGTTSALPNGKELRILGNNNAPVLDDIAWYGGNSSVGFELGNGENCSSWSEKQYAGNTAGTHPVGQKQPNAWGLYDMIGNVWEWTQDLWNGESAYPAGDVVDPVGTSGSYRVYRGGSWNYNACNCRSANRYYYVPGYRLDFLGVRLVCAAGPHDY